MPSLVQYTVYSIQYFIHEPGRKVVLENKPVLPAIMMFVYSVLYSTVHSIVYHIAHHVEYSVKSNLQEAWRKERVSLASHLDRTVYSVQCSVVHYLGGMEVRVPEKIGQPR